MGFGAELCGSAGPAQEGWHPFLPLLCRDGCSQAVLSPQPGCQYLLGKFIPIHNLAMCSRHRMCIFWKRDCIRGKGQQKGQSGADPQVV